MVKTLPILAFTAVSLLTLPVGAQNSPLPPGAFVLAQAVNVAEMTDRLAKLRERLAAAETDEQRQELNDRIARLEQRLAKAQAASGGEAEQAAEGAPAETPEASAGGEANAEATAETQPAEAATQGEATAGAEVKKAPVEEQSAAEGENQPAAGEGEAAAQTQAETAPAQDAGTAQQAPETAEQHAPAAEATATAETSAEAEAQAPMTEEEQQRADRRRERREARRAEREKEADSADTVQEAVQTVESVKPAGDIKVTEENGQQVQSQEFRSGDGRVIEKVIRTNRDGDKVVITRVTRADGTVVERKRIIDNADRRDDRRWRKHARRDRRTESGVDVVINIPFGVDIAPERYVVEGRAAPIEIIYDTLVAAPIVPIERSYSLEEVTQSEEVRAMVPRIDLDTVTFEFGQATLPDDQVRNLDKIATAMEDVLAKNPDQVFLLEGHTDAVGSELYNLQLSELRAQSVKYALVDGYGLPEDAFVTEGYGEEYLKVPTEEAERVNRRVTVRNITSLVQNNS